MVVRSFCSKFSILFQEKIFMGVLGILIFKKFKKQKFLEKTFFSYFWKLWNKNFFGQKKLFFSKKFFPQNFFVWIFFGSCYGLKLIFYFPNKCSRWIFYAYEAVWYTEPLKMLIWSNFSQLSIKSSTEWVELDSKVWN